MAMQPVLDALAPERAGKGVVGVAQHGHEDLCLARFGLTIYIDRHGLPGEIQEQLVAGQVYLAHHQRPRPQELPIAGRELG